MDKPCTLLVAGDKHEAMSASSLRQRLEKGSDDEKVTAMKQVITMTINGENPPGALMAIIRFVLTSKHKPVKRLCLFYLEIIDKTDSEGKLMPEMILVCNALRNDLNSPNEYIRGVTCRFLCKIKEMEILEPLVPSVRSNLEHRHSFVRRNAVLCVYSIYRLHDQLIPDAPELIYNFLVGEADSSCKRNAFLMLINTAPEKAVEYLASVVDQIESFNDVMQFTVVELVRKLVRQNPNLRGKYIKIIYTLLKSPTPAVRFEAAYTLVLLSSAPSAIKAAATTFIDLLCNESDNNVKLIVLDRLAELKRRHMKVMSELVMDVLRALSAPSLEIRRKTLAMALDLINLKNIDEVVQVLKKEIGKTQARELEKQDEYRQMLIQAIHTCAVRFPDVAQSVVHMLMDFLSDTNVASAVDVVVFVREVVETYPHLRESIVKKLVDTMDNVRSSKVFRAALWIVGEYSQGKSEIVATLQCLKTCMGEPPLVDPEHTEEAVEVKDKDKEKEPPKKAGPKLNADGTYASQSALMEEYSTKKEKEKEVPHLRALLLAGDFYLGAIICTTLLKLTLRLLRDPEVTDANLRNRATAQSLLYMTSILRLGRSTTPPQPIDKDSYERICVCARLLLNPKDPMADVFVAECRQSFKHMLVEQQRLKAIEDKENEKKNKEKKKDEGDEGTLEIDQSLKLRQLRSKKSLGHSDLDEDDADLGRATGATEKEGEKEQESKLSRVVQLTGWSDPIFAEAYVTVHQYDIVLDITMINQTDQTLQNVCVELATLGDLKLVERPQYLTIAPRDKKQLKASIKVSSTETGIIFGNIVYDIAGQAADADRNCVILSDIHIDIMDYIQPASCTDVQFRTMWSQFEWENKVAVNTNIEDVDSYLEHIVRSTNMRCLTPTTALSGKCGFIAANLYAKSIFGEDALANVSIEKSAEGKIGGFVRIRSKTQGIALSLGDKITLKQRGA